MRAQEEEQYNESGSLESLSKGHTHPQSAELIHARDHDSRESQSRGGGW